MVVRDQHHEATTGHDIAHAHITVRLGDMCKPEMIPTAN